MSEICHSKRSYGSCLWTDRENCPWHIMKWEKSGYQTGWFHLLKKNVKWSYMHNASSLGSGIIVCFVHRYNPSAWHSAWYIAGSQYIFMDKMKKVWRHKHQTANSGVCWGMVLWRKHFLIVWMFSLRQLLQKKKVFPLLSLSPRKKGTVGRLREESIRAHSIRGKQRLFSHFGPEPQQAHFGYPSGYSDLFKMQIWSSHSLA